MDTNSRLYSQVAGMACVAPERAMVACYLTDLLNAGKTLDEAAQLMRSTRAKVRKIARDWGIAFPDIGEAERLEWEKEARGRWILRQGGEIVAEATSYTANGCSGYRAKTLRGGLTAEASKAESAIRQLSIALTAGAVDALKTDDVEISMPDVGILAPKPEPLADAMKRALAS